MEYINKKKTLLLLLILINFSTKLLGAQVEKSEFEKHDYYGAIKLNDTTLITYKLIFELNVDDTITGYSITDIAGDHETKSHIKGKYDRGAKILSFKESSILYTKSPVSELDFCFINFYSDSFKLNGNKLKGQFVGRFSDNTECINGEILMQKSEKVVQRVTKISKKIESSNKVPDSLKQRANPLKMMDKLNTNMLKENKVMSVFSSQDELQLILYDGGQEDGDIVSIYVNGEKILDRYLISQQKQVLKIPLTSGKTSIVIKAESVGTISTNTAVVELNDSINNIKALTNLNKGEVTTIDVLK